MSSTTIANLSTFSSALTDLVQRTVSGVIAVKAAPYRVVSGVALANDLVAISDHSLRREDRIPIQTSDGAQANATILGRDPSVDLAILKLEGLKLNPLQTADPASWKPGSLAAVVGLTMDVGPTVSLGILGAVGGSRRTWRGGTLDHFLRLDVNLYPSQSGAAVVDIAGNLIGLATPALLRHSAVAVPLVTLNRIAQELVKEGRIRHGYLGISLQPVVIPDALRKKIDIQTETGLMLLSIEPESPADQAGLQLGDILVSLDGKPVGDIDDLQTALRGDAVGRTLKAVLIRGGEMIEAQIAISERPKKAR
ncbi:MAG: serine protease [Acidobacteriaceae bacterium]|nr:serine protease [Acidobacteriaceae bacterium]